jgi:hypothetical protein
VVTFNLLALRKHLGHSLASQLTPSSYFLEGFSEMELQHLRHWFVIAAITYGVTACSAHQPGAPAASAPPAQDQRSASAPSELPQEALAPPESKALAPSAGMPQIQEEASSRAESERPGLATQFGEYRESSVRQGSFSRNNPSTPFTTATFWYNDADGIRSISTASGSMRNQQATQSLLNGGLVVNLLDENNRVLPGLVADSKYYAVGAKNARYAIEVRNRTEFTFEVLASVDGLDVINGQPAAFDHRGYLLAPRDTLLIEGFRTSANGVAAFRFGSVQNSYSVAVGHGDKNIGVIGVAFFEEQGKTPAYPSDDARKREQANPFPGTYAPPPPPPPPDQPLYQ